MNPLCKLRLVLSLLIALSIFLAPACSAPLSQSVTTYTAPPNATYTSLPLATVSPFPMSPPPPTVSPVATWSLPTLAPVIANGQEPPPCTFPLAQMTATESAPENYTFSAPHVALTVPKGDYYHIFQWLPDNQQVLITEDLLSNHILNSNTIAYQSISLFNALTGVSKVYAIRPGSLNPPAWNPTLNVVVYPAENYTIDSVHGSYTFTRQVWISHGDPNTAQKMADNLSQFPLGMKPDGSKMIYLSNNKLNGWDKSLLSIPSISFDPTQWDYAKDRRDNYPVIYSLAWQPGTSLVFLYSESYGRGGYTFILNMDTGKVCELNLGGFAFEAHWSSDGRYLAFVRSTKYTYPTFSADLAVLDSITGNLKVLDVMPKDIPGKHYARDFAWAPDNRHMAAIGEIDLFSNNPDETGLYLVDMVFGQSIKIDSKYSYNEQPNSIAWSADGSKLAVLCPEMGIGANICLITVQQTGQ